MIKDFLSKKQLLNAAKALYFIYSTHYKIIQSIKSRKKLFRQSKSLVLSTIDKIKDVIGIQKAVRAFGISYQQYYAWGKQIKCNLSPVSLCRKLYHNQLTFKEVDTIKKYLTDVRYNHWNVSSVYFQMLREKAAFISRTSFYKYTNLFSMQRVKPQKRRNGEGLRASVPKKILHMDVTIFRPLNHSKVYLYFLVDNYSRFILGWKASLSYSANITFQNIFNAYQKYNLGDVKPYIDLVCDGGSENKGMVDIFINHTDSNIKKLVAQTDIIFSNSMIEAVNKRMKYDFLFTTELLDFDQTKQFLSSAVDQYNNKPHSALFGLTPFEVFNGAIPDKLMFKNDIRQAALNRKTINLEAKCLNCYR